LFANLRTRASVQPPFLWYELFPVLAVTAGVRMDIFDQRIRNELAARIEADPQAVSYVNASVWQGCWTVIAVIASFACGLAIGSSLFR
jgi:hypothetical protein